MIDDVKLLARAMLLFDLDNGGPRRSKDEYRLIAEGVAAEYNQLIAFRPERQPTKEEEDSLARYGELP